MTNVCRGMVSRTVQPLPFRRLPRTGNVHGAKASEMANDRVDGRSFAVRRRLLRLHIRGFGPNHDPGAAWRSAANGRPDDSAAPPAPANSTAVCRDAKDRPAAA